MIISGYSATPRSGSTLLNALLNQRPDVYMPFVSPFIELLWRNYKFWDEPEYNKLHILEYKNIKKKYCLGVIDTFFKELTDRKYIIDKQRVLKQGLKGELAHIDNLDYSINLLNKVYLNQQHYIENNPDNIVFIEYNDWCNKTKEMLKYIEVELGLEAYSYDLKNPSIDTKYIDKLMGNDKLHVLRDASVYKKRY